MTPLTYVVERVTPGDFASHRAPLAVALVPRPDNNPLLVMRLKGRRTGLVVTLADVYRVAALWHGQKEKRARCEARKNGVPWRRARKQFLALPPMPRRPRKVKEDSNG